MRPSGWRARRKVCCSWIGWVRRPSAATLACWLTRNALESRFPIPDGAKPTKEAAIVLIGALLVATAVYAGLAFALHMEEMAPLRRMLRKRAAR